MFIDRWKLRSWILTEVAFDSTSYICSFSAINGVRRSSGRVRLSTFFNQRLTMDKLPVNNVQRDKAGVSQELPDIASDDQEVASDELFWYDAHFGETEPSERMFTSLQLGGSSPTYDCFEPPQHHSLDDMNSHCRPRSAKGLTANGKSDVRNADDDDDDIDMETMKNKFLSAWINAKNGLQLFLKLWHSFRTVVLSPYTNPVV